MSSHERKKHIIIFDIDSASIGAAVVACHYTAKGDLEKVRSVFELREDISLTTSINFDDFFARTLKTFEHVAKTVYLQALDSLEGVYCNVSAPWISSQKRIIHYEHKKPFEVTKKLVESCIEKEIESSFSTNLDFKHHGNVTLVERRTVDMYLNGYSSLKPYGKQANTMDIHSLSSVMSETTKQAFEHIVERVFSRKVHFFSNTFVSYQTVRTILPHEDSCIVLDISGELSEIFVIVDDHLKHIASFASGMNSIVRDVASRLHMGYQKAFSLVRLSHQESFDPHYQKTMTDVIDRAFRDWLQEFFAVLDALGKDGLLPDTLCLSMDHRLVDWFQHKLLQTDMLAQHMHARSTHIKMVRTAEIFNQDLTHMHPTVVDFSDSQLAMVASFVSRIY